MILALLLATAQPTPAWLAGRWVPVSDASAQDNEACTGTDAKSWRVDGSFADATAAGAWQLIGGKLAERVVTEDDLDDAAPRISTVKRLGADRMRLTDAEGEQVEWRRCR